MRIGYLIQDFPPEVGAGPARVLEMSKLWQARGAETTVITAMPNRRIPGRGDGVIDAAYRGAWFLREEWEGVDTMRSWLFTSTRRGFAATLANNLSFSLTSLLHGLLRRPRIDVLIASSPPFFPLATGVALSRALGVPLVVELRDLWPDYLQQLGLIRSPLILNPLFRFERWILARAARVVVVTESFRARVVEKGVPADRIDVIPNGVDLDAYHASDEPPPIDALKKAPGGFVVGYLGTFGRGQNLAGVVEAAAFVGAKDPSVRFVIAGDGPDRTAVLDAIEQFKATNVTVVPPIPRSQTRAFYNACDACLVPLAPIPVFQETIPSKIFEVMACERPVVASLAGEGARIIDDSRGGLHCAPGNPGELARQVLALRSSSDADRRAMGRAGRAYVTANYSRQVIAERYERILSRVGSAPG